MASKERDGRPTEDGAEQMETGLIGELKGHQPTLFLTCGKLLDGWMTIQLRGYERICRKRTHIRLNRFRLYVLRLLNQAISRYNAKFSRS